MPGYGYSEMSKMEQKKVADSINIYLKNRQNINLIILLVDIRHKPTENDKTMINYIRETGKRYIVLTSKSDKIAKTKIQTYVDDIAKELDIPEDLIFAFSSETKFNLDTILDVIEESLNS